MRVIAGQYRSRLLKSLKGNALRPTSDKLRETLFNVLGPNIAGSRFLDIFAGTGAVGIEALSRRKVEVVFIENHDPAAALTSRKLESLAPPTPHPRSFPSLRPTPKNSSTTLPSAFSAPRHSPPPAAWSSPSIAAPSSSHSASAASCKPASSAKATPP
jgi:hypothetical protein